MKKIGIFLIAALFAGCTKESGGVQANFVMAAGGTSGTYYAYGGAIAQVLSESIENSNFNVQATGASAANLRLVSEGDADLALVQNDVMSYAYTGAESFADNKITKFAAIAALYPEVCQIIADSDSGIKAVADLRGKRVSVGDVGSGVESNARQILAESGISFDDIQKQNLGFGDSATALKDKKIDAFFVTSGIPNTAVMDLAATNSFVIVPIDLPTTAQIVAKFPFYVPYTIPAGTYKDNDSDVNSVAVKATLIARQDLPDDVVYEITKALFEKQPELAAAHAKGAELNVADAISGIAVPFHVGAERYFREIGKIE